MRIMVRDRLWATRVLRKERIYLSINLFQAVPARQIHWYKNLQFPYLDRRWHKLLLCPRDPCDIWCDILKRKSEVSFKVISHVKIFQAHVMQARCQSFTWCNHLPLWELTKGPCPWKPDVPQSFLQLRGNYTRNRLSYFCSARVGKISAWWIGFPGSGKILIWRGEKVPKNVYFWRCANRFGRSAKRLRRRKQTTPWLACSLTSTGGNRRNLLLHSRASGALNMCQRGFGHVSHVVGIW